jgi:hypothetical protein
MREDGYFGQRRGQQPIAAPDDFDFDFNFDEFKRSIITAIFEMLENGVKDTAYWSMPIVWDYGDDPSDGENGPPIDDPTTIDVSVTLIEDYLDVEYRFSFRELVHSEILDFEKEPQPPRGMLRLRDELRKLADEIDVQFNQQPAAASPAAPTIA